MRSKQLLFIFIGITFLAACSSDNRRFKVIGNITGLPEQTVVLEQLNANDVITIVDSAQSKSDGHFELSSVASEPGLYRIHFASNKYILLSVDKGNIVVEGSWDALEDYNINGSPPSQHLKNFIVSIREHLGDFNTMSIVLDSLQARGNDSILSVAKTDFMDMKQKFTQFVERYADTTPYQPNAIFAARILNPATEIHYLEAFSQSLNRRFPGTKLTREYMEHFAKVSQKQKQPVKPTAPQDGTIAPEITLPDADGKEISLSSFRGKFVLVDFWASWCGPCRAENPNVVAAYAKYKNHNFTVLGVSLDEKKDAWQSAIKDDELTWTHVSDLKGWESPAAMAYGVQSIPSNFLVDTAGKIIATNLRGHQLEEVLEEALNKKEQAPNP